MATDLTASPSDAEARNLIESAIGETLFVEAGAGTGKTTALVRRIVALIREGVPITSIAAITFTEKAASELAERVRERLEVAEQAASGALRERYHDAIRDLDQAAIQTLHSFAMRILGFYPLEAGLPPALKLRDDVEAKLAFRERWQRFQDELLDDPALERVLLRGLTLGLRLNDLRILAEDFNENWERLESVQLPGVAEPRFQPRGILQPIREVAALRNPLREDSLTEKLDKLAGFTEFLEGVSRAFETAADDEAREQAAIDFLRLVSRVEKLTKPRWPARQLGNRDNWDVKHVRALMEDAEERRQEVLDSTRAHVICALLPSLREFVLRGVAERRARGELEFHDLLVLARNLLRDNAEVRAALHRRFTRVLIDEFQDTDPLQVELAALLAALPEAPAGDWALAVPEAGRLFFVGDPKQSIYRFRRADIDLFKRARGAFGSRVVPLTQNFRCRPGIIEWVNAVCRELFGGFGAGADARQADWIALEAAKPEAEGPSVHFLGGPRGQGNKEINATHLRAEEAEAIVATILKARQENWLAREDKTAVTRFADIAILLPTRTNAPVIERALGEAGIPVRVESRSLLFAAQEIRDLTNILAAIDDPTDDVAVVAALRTPAFAVSDADLLAHAAAGGRWDYTRIAPEASPEPMRAAFESLAASHLDRWHRSIGALVERVVAQRKMLELAATSPRPRESWRRLRFVSEQARVLDESGAVTSLRQFVQWLRTQAEENTRIAEAVANEPDDDAVRMLTIHAAKGLEFPIVILAGLGIGPRNTGPRVAWARDTEGETLAVHCGRMEAAFDSPNYEGLKQFEREHSFLERDRLFYVAATRAKERLVVSLFFKSYGEHAKRHAEQKCAIAECLDALREPAWDNLQYGMPMGPGVTAEITVNDTPEEREAWIASRAEVITRLGRAPVLAATAIAHAGSHEENERDDVPEGEPWKKGRAGTSVGRAVHAVLQTIDLETGEGLDATAHAQAVAEGIANEGDRIAKLADAARTSAVVREAVAGGKFWREVYVGAPIEGTLIEGFIDLLYEGPDGLVVVDYKTDSARDIEAIDRAMGRYRLQGAAYALVLEQALGRPVARMVFVFAEPQHEQELAGLEGAEHEVLAHLRSRLIPAAG